MNNKIKNKILKKGCFNGVIDEVRIYDVALSSAQVKQRYVESAFRHGIVLK